MSDREDELVPTWTDDGHLDEGTIHTWLDGAFDQSAAEQVSAHVDGCAVCRESVAEARGFIAGASRMLRALDESPSGVVPAADVARTASRIVAASAMSAGAASYLAAAPAAVDAVRAIPPQPRPRPWYQSPGLRAAAALVVVVGGSSIILSRQSADVATTAAPMAAPMAASSEASATALRDSGPKPSASIAAAAPEQRDNVASKTKAEPLAKKRAEARESDVAVAARASTPMPMAGPPMALATTPPPAAAPPVASPVVADANKASARGDVAVSEKAERAVREKFVVGRVTATDGRPIEGVNVTVAGTTVASTTDKDGRFTLRTPVDSGTLLTRRIGYESARTSLALRGVDTARSEITLKASTLSLSSVVVQSESPPPVERRRALASASPKAEPSTRECWNMIVNSSGEPMQLPVVDADSLFTKPGRYGTTWIGWPRAGVRVTVPFTLDARGVLSATGETSGFRMTLTLTRSGKNWSGTALQQVNGTRFERDVTLVWLGDNGMCKQ